MVGMKQILVDFGLLSVKPWQGLSQNRALTSFEAMIVAWPFVIVSAIYALFGDDGSFGQMMGFDFTRYLVPVVLFGKIIAHPFWAMLKIFLIKLLFLAGFALFNIQFANDEQKELFLDRATALTFCSYLFLLVPTVGNILKFIAFWVYFTLALAYIYHEHRTRLRERAAAAPVSELTAMVADVAEQIVPGGDTEEKVEVMTAQIERLVEDFRGETPEPGPQNLTSRPLPPDKK